MKNMLIVGGTFDELGGKPSSLIEKLFKDKIAEHDLFINGGHIKDIEHLLELVPNYKVIIWFPNIPNHYPKLRNIKQLNPHSVFVMSKRNDNKYKIRDIIVKGLENNANLIVEFSKHDNKFYMQDIDVLGYSWSEKTADINKFKETLFARIEFLLTTKRISTHSDNTSNNNYELIPDEFIELNKSYAQIFDELLIDIAQTTRFLGNCSLRVDNKIFMSKRDIDKKMLNKQAFIEVYEKNNQIFYKGNFKPSKDTAIQLSLYNTYKQINYIIHCHCYIEDGYFTSIQCPCGDLKEIDEINEVINKNNLQDNNIIKINLIGHGSILMTNNIKDLYNINYVKRNFPEIKEESYMNEKKNILITAGPTNEYIDEVMKITNMSTGRLGIELTRNYLDSLANVTLIATRSVFKSGLFEKYQLAKYDNLKSIPIETTTDMYKALERESTNLYDLIIHSAAVGDYKPEFSFKMEDITDEIVQAIKMGKVSYEEILNILTNPNCKVNDNTKISSYEPNLTVKLTLTPKLISYLREWYPNATLVGFKLLENTSKENLIEVARNLCIKNNMDYIIANDLHDLRQGDHLSYLVNRNGYQNIEFHSPQDIYNCTKKMILKK
ncbi:MAG: class II aldolase/adducin family protein [Bacilli bacterium]|nr:class II aldolase/adducin family protein [Bacilli bacterium]